MNTISDSYRFYLDIPGVGVVQAYPQNSELKWVHQLKKGYRFHQKVLETKLVFIDAPALGIYDFTKLANLERQGKTCERVGITMDRFCDCDNTWEIGAYKGYLRLSQADSWNFSLAKVGLPVVVVDAYACMNQKWDKEINMFDFGDAPEEVTPLIGELQLVECESGNFTKTWTHPNIPPIAQAKAYVRNHWLNNYQNSCLPDITLPDLGPWTLVRNTYVVDFWITPAGGLFAHPKLNARWKIKTKYAREFFAGVVMPPGALWEPCTGGFHRPVSITGEGVYDWDNTDQRPPIEEAWAGFGDIDDGEMWRNLVTGFDINGNAVLTNGKALGPFLVDWFSGCGLTVISNFFNINPDATNPVNDYYSRAAEDAFALYLFQVTDVARLDETVSATKALFAIKQLIDTLKMAYNVDITITDGTILRIEHESYFARIVGLDLTRPELEHFIEERWAYSYNQEKLPKKEGFAWAVQTDKEGGDFDGYPIEYQNACVDDLDEATEVNLRSTKFLTNVSFVMGNEDFFDSKEILIVATSEGAALSSIQPISGTLKFNGNAALGYLLPRYHDYGRPFKKGFINKVETVLYSTVRQKTQVDIPMTMSCLDYRDNFRAEDLVKTQLGAGLVEKATWTEPDETLVLTLNHK